MDSSRFSADRLNRIAEMERWHFWFVGRQSVIDRVWLQFVDDECDVLDIGCGTGYTSHRLIKRGCRVVSMDIRPEGLLTMRRQIAAARPVQAAAPTLPFSSDVFDVVVTLDVLEHVDDRATLGEVMRVLHPGGWLIATVPALPWLWSYRDDAAGHLRRYTHNSLRQRLVEAGFSIRAMRYYQSLLLPPLILSRLLGRRGPALRDLEDRPSPGLNTVMSVVNRLEIKLGKWINWPLGSSLIAVCQKQPKKSYSR
ncbi:MAG: class I SAM-dependent methyltransferase [Anaerolineae bacterium]|nr:class I SAM-dependent methyltransferase [Thermoflexales bacterium]MDW8407254.1 class I SAM-dependent methyltransferase [Anaerolineae bacterium]